MQRRGIKKIQSSPIEHIFYGGIHNIGNPSHYDHESAVARSFRIDEIISYLIGEGFSPMPVYSDYNDENSAVINSDSKFLKVVGIYEFIIFLYYKDNPNRFSFSVRLDKSAEKVADEFDGILFSTLSDIQFYLSKSFHYNLALNKISF